MVRFPAGAIPKYPKRVCAPPKDPPNSIDKSKDISPVVKRAGREAEHSRPSSGGVENL